MRKLIIFLITAVLMGCNCLSQLPIQTLYVGESCEVALPDYRDRVSAKDNCVITSLMQAPVPGTILDAGNPYVNVVIIATDISNNKSSVDFDVVIIDTISPIIDVDTSLFACGPIDRSNLMNAYHTSLGKEMHAAANGPDSIWTYSYLHDTSYWDVNPMLNADSIFDNMSMLMITGPGFGGTSMGTFIDPDSYVMPLDSNQVADLGYIHLVTLKLGPEDMPVNIDAGMDTQEWYTESQVHYRYYPSNGLDEMYLTERYGNFSYRIPTGEGQFNVKLHFAEIYWDNPGQRVFNVKIEGKEVLHDLDILATVGKNTPLIYDFSVTVGRDGWLDIEFWASEDLAKISGIVISNIGQVAEL